MKKLIAMILAAIALSAIAVDWKRGTAVDGAVRFAPDKDAPGYLPIEDICPRPIDDDHMIAVDHWENRGGKCVCVYKQVEIPATPPAVRTFSKIRLKMAIAKLGKLAALEAWLSSFEVAPGYSALEAWNDATVIQDDFDGFAQLYAAAKVALGVDDATAEAILEACVTAGAAPEDL